MNIVIHNMADDRCNITIYDRISVINTVSFNDRSKHIQKAEITIYTESSKTEFGVGFINHKNRRNYTKSIHMPDTSTVFQVDIEAINHACQFMLAYFPNLNINYVKILSDSQAAVKAFNRSRIPSALEHMETLASKVKHLNLAG